MNIQCVGYPNLLSQKFRDETESVMKRAEKSYRKSVKCTTRQQEPIEHYTIGAAVNVVHPTTMTASVPPTLSLLSSMEDVAIANFMSSYIPGSHFDYLPSLYGQAASNSVLSLTVRATAIAYLSQEVHHGEIMLTARTSYARALHKTNGAIAHSCTASSDSTLISVLLLGLFESLVRTSAGTPACWTTHTEGAFAIIRLRGLQQLKTPLGQRLFAQVANILCINSLRQKSRLPRGLEDLIELVLEYDPNFPPYQLTRLTSRVATLVADIHIDNQTVSLVVQRILQLDDDYKHFAIHLPSDWQCQRSTLNGPEKLSRGDEVHWYPSHRALRIWNSYRMTRILLNEAVHTLADELARESKSQIQRQAVANIEEMATEICASSSYIFSCSNLRDIMMEAGPLAITSVAPRALAASLLWPLSAVRGASLASKGIRAHCVRILRYLAIEARVRLAIEVASHGPEFDAMQDGLHVSYVS